MIDKIGLGGGCHWCTEGVFQSLIGINEVKQGWIASDGDNAIFSEAIEISFNPNVISLEDLIQIHLYTHSSTSNHSFRKKYRSAVYTFNAEQQYQCKNIISKLQLEFDKNIITQVLLFKEFKINKENYLNYLYTRKDNSFCKTYIHPKLSLLLNKFSSKVNYDKIKKI